MSKGQYTEGFGGLARDYTGSNLQTATRFATVDISGTPKVSPLAYSSSILTITVPNFATQLVLAPSTALRVSEDPAMASYYLIPAGACEALSVALMPLVYIKRDTADGTVSFRFAGV